MFSVIFQSVCLCINLSVCIWAYKQHKKNPCWFLKGLIGWSGFFSLWCLYFAIEAISKL